MQLILIYKNGVFAIMLHFFIFSILVTNPVSLKSSASTIFAGSQKSFINGEDGTGDINKNSSGVNNGTKNGREIGSNFDEVSSCSKEIILSPYSHPREVITSPHFPHNYHHSSNNLNCTIIIKLSLPSHIDNLRKNFKGTEEKRLKIELIFSYFKSRESSLTDCKYDYLEIESSEEEVNDDVRFSNRQENASSSSPASLPFLDVSKQSIIRPGIQEERTSRVTVLQSWKEDENASSMRKKRNRVRRSRTMKSRRTDATDFKDKTRKDADGNRKDVAPRRKRRKREQEGESWEEKDSDVRQRFCGDWNSRIKLLRKIGKRIVVKIFSSKSNSFPRFRAEARIINVPSEVHSFNKGRQQQLCDNQRFVYYKNNCYFVSTYPHVSWFTASQICSDIESSLLEIRDKFHQEDIIEFLTTNNLRADRDFPFSSVPFWLNKNNREPSTLYPFPKASLRLQNGLDSSSHQGGFVYDPLHDHEPPEDWNKPLSTGVNLGSHFSRLQTGRNITFHHHRSDFGTAKDVQQFEQTDTQNKIRSRVTTVGKHVDETEESGPEIQTNSQESHKLGSINKNNQEVVPYFPLPDLSQVDDNYKCTAAFVHSGTTTTSNSIIYDEIPCNEQTGYICIKKPIDLSGIANVTMNGSQGQVTSVNYPNSYLNNLDYYIQIFSYPNNMSIEQKLRSTHRKQVIVVWFKMLDIEYQESCLYDYIEINDGHEQVSRSEDAIDNPVRHGIDENDHLKRICGKIHDSKGLLSRVYFTSSNNVSLRFHSDHSNRGNGFLLHWQSLDISSCDTWFIFSPDNSSFPYYGSSESDYGEKKLTFVNIFQSNGSITSPGYPNWLIPSLNCSMHLSAPSGYRVLLTIIDVDLGEQSEQEESPDLPRSFSSSSKFNKCFLKNRIHSKKTVTLPRFISSASSSIPWVPGVPFDDDFENKNDEAHGKEWGNVNHKDEGDQATSDYIVIYLDPGEKDEKIITICGNFDDNDYLIGQNFLSYNSNVRIQLVTANRKFGQEYIKRRGFKFNYEFISLNRNRESKIKNDEIMSITSVIPVKIESIGRVTSLNFPHIPPKGVRHKIILRGEVGTNIDLRITKSYVNLLKNGSCESASENTVLTVKDYFGDISFYPPIPNVWSICSINNPSDWFEGGGTQKSIRGGFSHVNRIKSILSNFHVISIESTAFSNQTPFLFYYKSFQDKNFTRKALVLPNRYLQESCDGFPCSNHGTCVTKEYKNSSLNYCKCNHHWTGLFCHMTLCERSPCGDRGVCKLDLKENRFNCHCNPGYTGKTCRDILEKCERNNPCRDRGRCSMINGEPNCSCQPWFEGKFCERFRFKGQYKPLSQRMLEEPFWLGLIAIGSVVILISFAYCIKKMFADKIEQFFTEEIEKAKYMPYNFTEVGSGPRYSVTSNIGLNVNVVNTPGSRNGTLSGDGGSPLPRSRSSIIGKLRKKGFKSRRSGGGHVSDSEVFRSHESRLQEMDSDVESAPTPASRRFPSFFLGKRGSSGCSINNGNTNSHRDSCYIEMKQPNPDALETSKILAGLVQPATSSNRDRRMSLDDFMKATEAKIRKRKLLEIEGYNVHEYEKRSPGSLISETSFITGHDGSTPGDRCIPTIAEFHVITENSMEEVESTMSNGSRTPSNPKLMIEHWSSDRENSLSDKLSVLKQESEIEGILTDIRSIQRAAAVDISTTSHSEDSDHREAKSSIMIRPASPRPRLSRPPSGFSSSSSDSKDAQLVVPSITVTEVCIEYEPSLYPEDVDEEEEAQDEYDEAKGREISVRMFDRESAASSYHKKCFDMNMRRASVPNPGIKGTGEVRESGKIDLSTTRKYSLDVEKPKITITADYDAQIHNSTKCSRRRVSTGQCSDRTVSESNISTSGYSSFSSPGISRCSSSSPITDFTCPLQTTEMPKVTLYNDMVTNEGGGPTSPISTGSGKQSKHKSTFGNFLTIPSVSYSLVPHQHQSNSPPFKGKDGDGRQFVFPSSTPSRRASQESRDEGIDVSSVTSMSSSKFTNSPTSSIRRERFTSHTRYSLESTAEETSSYNIKGAKIIHNSRSFDCFPDQSSSQSELRVHGSLVGRQPSWPGLLLPPPEGSPSSDSDADTIREQEHERKLMLLKRQERRSRSDSNQSLNKSEKGHQSRRELFKSRSRSPLTRFSQSTDAAYHDESSYRYSTAEAKNVRPGFVRCNSARSLIMTRSLYLDDESSSQSSESLLSSSPEDDPSSNVTTIKTARSLNTINFQSPSRTSTGTTTTTTSGSGRDYDNLFSPLSRGVIKKSPSERILIQMRETSQSLPNEASGHHECCCYEEDGSSREVSPCPHHQHHENTYRQFHAISDMVVNRNSKDFLHSSSLALHQQNRPLHRDQSLGNVKQSLPKGIKRLLQKGKSTECPGIVRSLSVSPSFSTSAREETCPSLSSEERYPYTNLSPSPTSLGRSRTSLVRQKASFDIPP